MRPEVLAFARLMEAKLRQNEGKTHWRDCLIPASALALLGDELQELYDAVLRRDSQAVAEEAADIANFAMMVTDLFNALEVDKRG